MRTRPAGHGLRLRSHAGTSPSGVQRVKVHARDAAPKAALTTLNPGGPLLARDLWGGLPTKGALPVVPDWKAQMKISYAGSAFGVRLVRDPSNEFDKNAIRVVGFWKHAGIFRLVEKRALLGFVDASTAKDLCTEFGDAPLAARLLSFYESQTGFIDLKIIILVPGKHATHQSASSS